MGGPKQPPQPLSPGAHLQNQGTPGHLRMGVNASGQPVAMSPSPVVRVYRTSGKSLLDGAGNADRDDGKPIDARFDWLSPFETEKYVLVPEKLDADSASARSRACSLLSNSHLPIEIYARISEPTRRSRSERCAWILADGTLGEVRDGGNAQSVIPPPRPPKAVGVVHSHPTVPSFLSPPSHGGRGDEDYDDVSLVQDPVQLVVESNSGRLWQQFTRGRTSIIGRVANGGVFFLVSEDDPVAAVAYRTWTLDDWRDRKTAAPR